jgi:hypothetical protein
MAVDSVTLALVPMVVMVEAAAEVEAVTQVQTAEPQLQDKVPMVAADKTAAYFVAVVAVVLVLLAVVVLQAITAVMELHLQLAVLQ